ncbi:Alpha-tubulin suppressor and related RCC1 domain-containing protein-like protein [Anoxybacillus flavithermus]|uniref:phage tail protein n=1 Tax=Anoxybacillus flavithermus TaxID=33934 RepID=UPI0007D90F70|nr:phage tail protein [Anoxybacillus flavithermus]OAO80585.1 Alpha-tubulin suppressor and related RCC1 domain-containing protein-like protein [Anoxybacillus flavithermus]
MILSELNRIFEGQQWKQGTMSNLVLSQNGLTLESYQVGGIGTVIDDFESEQRTFLFIGDWQRTTARKASGQYSYTNKDIGDGQTSATEITVNLPQGGRIEFDYLVSSESGYDYLRFYINGVEQFKDSGNNTSFKHFAKDLTPGTYTFKWQYSKDGSVSSNDDQAYIDNLSITGVDTTMTKYRTRGTWLAAITNDMVRNVTGSRVIIDYEVPVGTAVIVEVSTDQEEWYEVVNGGELPNEIQNFQRLMIRATLQTQNEQVTPILKSIGISIWEEARGVRTLGRHSNVYRDIIRVYTLDGSLAAYLENAKNIYIDDFLNDKSILYFEIPFNDPKTKLIQYDAQLVYKNRRYIVTKIEDGMEENGDFNFAVTAELNYIELLNKVFPTIEINAEELRNGLEKILAGTGWKVGIIEPGYEDEIFSIKESRKTALWLVRQVAKIVGLEMQWDSMNRVINLVKRIGSNRGASFRYRKNLKSVKRTITPPEATVIIPYGKNGLTIADVNDGKNYIENYDWYISQGVTLSEARQKYRKEYILEDERFILPGNLKRYAEDMLKEMAFPRISYQVTVLDLSAITGLEEDRFYLGDDVRIYNEDLNLDVTTRILRMKVYPQEPWRNEVELGFLEPGLGDVSNDSISSDVQAAQPDLLFATSGAAKTIGTSPLFPLQISITNFGSTNAQIGLMLICEAKTALTVTVKIMMNGTDIGPPIKQYMPAGWHSIGLPFIIAQMPSGTGMLEIQMFTSTGTIDIPQDGLQMFVYAQNLLGGLSSEVPRPSLAEIYSINKTIHKTIQTHQAVTIALDGPDRVNVGEHHSLEYENSIATHAAINITKR